MYRNRITYEFIFKLVFQLLFMIMQHYPDPKNTFAYAITREEREKIKQSFCCLNCGEYRCLGKE